jgi:hypothetical protein
MGAGNVDIHERIQDEVTARRESLQSGAPPVGPDGEAWSADDIMKALDELDSDLRLLREHWKTGVYVTGGYPPPIAKACGTLSPARTFSVSRPRTS